MNEQERQSFIDGCMAKSVEDLQVELEERSAAMHHERECAQLVQHELDRRHHEATAAKRVAAMSPTERQVMLDALRDAAKKPPAQVMQPESIVSVPVVGVPSGGP